MTQHKGSAVQKGKEAEVVTPTHLMRETTGRCVPVDLVWEHPEQKQEDHLDMLDIVAGRAK
jgi:hypothetical protein